MALPIVQLYMLHGPSESRVLKIAIETLVVVFSTYNHTYIQFLSLQAELTVSIPPPPPPPPP